MADNSKKRKQPPDAAGNAKRPRFPQKPQHHIAVTSTKSAYPNGEINAKNFLDSHENEIRSLEHAMRAAKKGLARRAFQNVPREMRRRTASHNPQRVPKRLRMRARQETKEDNTPTSKGKSGSGIGKGKKKFLRKEGIQKSRKRWKERANTRKQNTVAEANAAIDFDGDTAMRDTTTERPDSATKQKTKRKFPALATPSTPASRFRRRQKDKTWLPTHVWHTKRARITEPKDPLWRFAIPLQPVVKAYRLTHRAAIERGAVAWDMSYVSTISLEGPEASIAGLLKGLNFAAGDKECPWRERGIAEKWRHGTRAWEEWLYERETRPPKKLAYVTVIWCTVRSGDSKRKAFIRVHPGAFLSLWNELIRLAKVQKPAVMVQDLRFQIGSIEIVGPASAEALCSILSPISTGNSSDHPTSVWPMLAPVTNAASLPAGALLAFNISDPRLHDPPTATKVSYDESILNSLTETLATWPIDNTQTSPFIFDTNARMVAARSLSSQKSINRRKSACTLGGYPEERPTDPQIPMLMYTSRKTKSWTILLPWKCVMPVWRGLMRYPVSSGGNPRFGGLKERRQVNFERSIPYFPYDHPGTNAGWEWELRQREVRRWEWTKRPKGKRIEWSTIDLGNGRKGEVGDPWASDWERLVSGPGKRSEVSGGSKTTLPSPFLQLSCSQASEFIEGKCPSTDYLQASYLFTVKITLTQRGVLTDCARIYRLPTNNSDLRNKWLSLLPTRGPKKASKKQQHRSTGSTAKHTQLRQLARSLLETPKSHSGPPKAGEDDYPVVPDEEDLIGFVTTGNYNLAEGLPTAVANLVLHTVVEHGGEGHGAVPKEGRLCIVRQAGSTIGRLATWEVV